MKKLSKLLVILGFVLIFSECKETKKERDFFVIYPQGEPGIDLVKWY